MGLKNEEIVVNSNKPSKEIRFLKVVEGAFVTDEAGETFNTVEGILKGITLQDDPGNKAARVKPYTALIINLEDGDEILRVKVHSEITFSWILGKFLANIGRDDLVKISVKPGKDPKVSIPRILKFDQQSNNWLRVEGVEFPSDQDARLEMLRDVVTNNSAYYEAKKRD